MVINYGRGGGVLKQEGGGRELKFYSYEKGGQKKFQTHDLLTPLRPFSYLSVRDKTRTV